MTTTLHAVERSERGRAVRVLRSRGVLPAVLYGPKEDSKALSLSHTEFEKVFRAAGESTVITLSGLDEEKEVLVQDIAHDPVSGTAIHVDFYAIEKGKKVQVNVPLVFEGEAPVEKQGGVVTKVLHELEVEAMPKDLPHEISVDVSVLTSFDSQIAVADIIPPAGVSILNSPEEVIAVAAEAVEEVEAPPEQVDMSAIEVEEKGKKEEESPDSEQKAASPQT